MTDFEPFPKIARLSRECVITEKLDGTNAQIYVTDEGRVIAGSRNRFITPDQDNHGFARWVMDHAAELQQVLGPGRHFGEWWGKGIQRGYNQIEKHFSLFNVSRWGDVELPEFLRVVPVLYVGDFSTQRIQDQLDVLQLGGSMAAPGYPFPEGVVIYHKAAANQFFKKTIERDEEPKGRR